MPPDPRPVQPSTVLARSRTLRAGSAGAAASATASLTVAPRGAVPEGRSGRRDGRIGEIVVHCQQVVGNKGDRPLLRTNSQKRVLQSLTTNDAIMTGSRLPESS